MNCNRVFCNYHPITNHCECWEQWAQEAQQQAQQEEQEFARYDGHGDFVHYEYRPDAFDLM